MFLKNPIYPGRVMTRIILAFVDSSVVFKQQIHVMEEKAVEAVFDSLKNFSVLKYIKLCHFLLTLNITHVEQFSAIERNF